MKLLDHIGGLVDSLFLTPPRLMLPLKPKVNLDRRTYEQQLDFYIKAGFTRAPETFFSFFESTPPHELVYEGAYHQGKYQIWDFPSRYQPQNPLLLNAYKGYTNNATACLVRWTHGDQGRDTVLCLHGYMLGEPRQAERMFKVRTLFELGLDVALFIAPFHWKRAASGMSRRGLFLQPDNVAMTCERFGQTMADLNDALLLLEALGSKRTGLLGASLGGYNAALFSCLSDRHAFAAMMVPAVNFSRPLGPDLVKMAFPVDETLQKKIALVWSFHSPVNLQPRLSPDNLLVVASRGDRLCPHEHTDRLCRTWQLPNCYFMTGGHWLIFNRELRGRVWYEFLEKMGFTSVKC